VDVVCPGGLGWKELGAWLVVLVDESDLERDVWPPPGDPGLKDAPEVVLLLRESDI
jgi:hypothetical protein